MIVDLTNVIWLDENHEVSFDELEKLSGLTGPELNELIENGALVPASADPLTFSSSYIVSVCTVRRLREDFELDLNALSLSLILLGRIRELENQIRDLRNQSAAELKRCHLKSQREPDLNG
jgi:chaperone modulatory protein CbpM